jgi:hypothetical protein
MKMTMTAALTAGICLLSTAARAGSPATANAIQGGAGVRYGIETNSGDFNPWAAGFGANAGFTLPMAIYVGGYFDYFFGREAEVEGVLTRGNVWDLMAEGGFDVGLGDIWVLRPKVGVGAARLSVETCQIDLQCSKSAQVDVALAPGATFLLVTRYFKLAFDVRYDLIFADTTTSAVVLSLGVGL